MSPPTEATPLAPPRQSASLASVITFWQRLKHDPVPPHPLEPLCTLRSARDCAQAGVHLTQVLKRHHAEATSAAKANSFVHRCVKMKIDPQGNFRSEDNEVFHVEPFSLRKAASQLHNYGCSVAVQLFLSFNIDACVLFLLMFAGKLGSSRTPSPTMLSNSSTTTHSICSGHFPNCGDGASQ